MGPVVGHQRRRRLARAPHPGPARQLHDPLSTSGRSRASRVAIVGDVKHSRVARSDIAGLHPAGRRGHPGGAAHAAAAQPRRLAGDGQQRPRRGAPEGRRRLPAAHAARAHDRGAAARRCASTRPASGSPPAGPTCSGPETLIMHPGPMNRGVEIAAEVADRPNAVIVDQVRNGVAVRMAVLFLLLGAGPRGALRANPGERASERHVDSSSGAAGSSTRPASGGPTSPSRTGRIAEVGADLDATGATVLDAGDCVVTPGFVDLHTHLREPGREEAETVETGARAAALGGFTAVRGHAQHRARRSTPPRSSARCSTPAPRRCARCTWPGSITVGREGAQPEPDGRDGRAGRARSSPTTAAACRTTG